MIQIDKWAGLVTNASPYSIPPGATVEQINVQCLVPGQLTVRPGMQPVTMPQPVPEGATVIKAFRYQHGAGEHLVYQTSDGAIYSTQIAAQSPPAGAPPSPPTIVSALAGVESIAVTLTAPAATGGSTVTGYSFQVSSDNKATWVGAGSSSALSATLTGLTAYVGYYVRAAASNQYGQGAYSAAYGVVTPSAPSLVTPPGPPDNVAAVAGNAVATVRWSAPVSNGNSAITSYIVVLSKDRGLHWDSVGTTSALTIEATGLINETDYIFRVAAVNSTGQGPFSAASASITPSAATNTPSAPTSVSTTATQTTIALSWSAPSSTGGSAITSYTVGYKLASGANWTSVAASSPYSIANLTPGTSYSVRVAASNANGIGPYTTVSQATSSATPVTKPSAPQNVAVDASYVAYTLTWSAPATDGGSPILAYKVERAASTDGPWTVDAETQSLLFNLQISLPSTSFFRVSAKNSEGYGAPTTISASIRSPPGAPTGVTVSPSATSAVISWTAPADLGSPTLSAYDVVVADSAGALVWTQSGATALTVTAIGLTPGTAYTARVTAKNSWAIAYSSPASFTTTAQLAAPLQPSLSVSAAGAKASLTLTVNAAESQANKDRLASGQYVYRFEYSTNSGASYSTLPSSLRIAEYTTSLASETLVFRGCIAQGSTALSPYAYSAAITLTTGAPGIPRSVSVAYTTGSNNRALSWLPPTTGSVSQYRVRQVYYSAGSARVGATATLAGNVSSYTVSAFDSYGATLEVAALGPDGSASAYVAGTEPTPSAVPEAPVIASVTPSAVGFTASWGAAFGNTGAVTNAPLQTYLLSTSTVSAAGPWTQQHDSLYNQATVSGFSAGQTVYIKLVAVNAVGSSAAATATTTTTGAPSLPGAPTELEITSRTLTAAAVTATLFWRPPQSNGSSSRIRYEVETANSTALQWSQVATPGPAATSVTCDLGRTKTPGIVIRIRAVNASGAGPWSDIISERQLASPFPMNLNVNGTTVYLDWTAPPTDSYESIAGYVVQSNASGAWNTVDTIVATPPTFLQPISYVRRSSVLQNQIPGTLYRVAAKGSVSGVGTYYTVGPTTFTDPPSAPTGATVQPDSILSRWATISWGPPQYDGGSPIVGYLVEQARYSTTVNSGSYYDYQLTWSALSVGPNYNGRVSASTLSVGPVALNRGSTSELGVAIRITAVNANGQTACQSVRLKDVLGVY